MEKRFRQLSVIILFCLFLIPIIFTTTAISDNSNTSQIYGYIIEVNNYQSYSVQTEITKLVNKLLHDDIPVYLLCSDANITAVNIKSDTNPQDYIFKRGSYIVPISEDSQKNIKITLYTNLYNIRKSIGTFKIMQPLQSIEVYSLKEPKIAHYEANSVSPSYYSLLKGAGFLNNIRLEPDEVVGSLNSENFNIFIWGGGGQNSSAVIEDLLSPIGLTIRSTIRRFVSGGGGFIGSCWGASRAASGYKKPIGYPREFGFNKILSLLPLQLNLINRPIYKALPGGGAITVKITDTDHPIAYGLPEIIDNCHYWGGPMFPDQILNIFKDKTLGIIQDVDTENWVWDAMMKYSLWWNTSLISNETKMEIANDIIKKSKGEAIWVTGEFGRGKVAVFGDHPEFSSTNDHSRNYSAPPRIVYNTIFYLVSSGPHIINLDKNYTFSEFYVNAQGPYEGLKDRPINFNGVAQGRKAPYKFYWMFELPYWYYYGYDFNETRIGQNITFTYDDWGNYEVSLIVVDGNGNVGFDKTSVEVLSRYDEIRVDVDIPLHAYVNENVKFKCNVFDGIPPFTYKWIFGDDFNSSNTDPVHSYKKPGTYKVTLEINDNYGGYEKITRYIEITEQESILTNPGSASMVIFAVLIVFIILILIFSLVIFLKRKNQN